MSRIYFHSPSGEAEVLGSERYYMGHVVSQLALAVFDPRGYRADETLRHITPPEHYAANRIGLAFADAFALLVSVGADESFILPDGRRPCIFTVCLNTALALGGDVVRLIARLHGQCEIHAWVDGPNRAWLAEIVEEGRASGVLRSGQGWESVAVFLRETDEEPVVTSFSVSDSFPNAYVANWRDEKDGDDWYDLPRAEQWRLAMEGLRQGEARRPLEMRPDDWTFPGWRFGQGDTAFSVLEAADKLEAEILETQA